MDVAKSLIEIGMEVKALGESTIKADEALEGLIRIQRQKIAELEKQNQMMAGQIHKIALVLADHRQLIQYLGENGCTADLTSMEGPEMMPEPDEWIWPWPKPKGGD